MKTMKTVRKLFGAMLVFLLLAGVVGTVPAEAASLIRSTLNYDAYLEPADEEFYGNYHIYTGYQTGFLLREGTDGTVTIASQSGRPVSGVANDTTVLYSLYKKNVLTIWKANIKTLKKTKVAAISIKAKEARLCGFYNNVVYYSAVSKKGAHLMFSYPLSTKVSKKMGSGVTPCAQVSRYLVYNREKLDGSEGAILKSYDVRTKKGVTIDSAAETVTRLGKYIYYSKYGQNVYVVAGTLQTLPAIQILKYNLDTNKAEMLVSIDREAYQTFRVTSKGAYLYTQTDDQISYFYVDYATGSIREASPAEISGV